MNDMQLQVAPTDPNGPRAPLRSNYDDPDGWESTGTSVDHLSFSAGESGHLGVDLAVLVGQSSSICGGTGSPSTCRMCGKFFPRPNFKDTNDVSGPCAPNQSTFSADIHGHVLVSCVSETRAHSEACDRLSVLFSLGKAREQVVANGFSAEVSAPLSCPLASLTIFSKSSGGSFGKDTRHAEHMTFTHPAPDVFNWCGAGVACYVQENGPTRELNGQRNASGWHNLKSDEAAVQILCRVEHYEGTDREMMQLSQNLLSRVSSCRQTAPTTISLDAKVFFCKQCGAVNAGGTLRLLKSHMRKRERAMRREREFRRKKWRWETRDER